MASGKEICKTARTIHSSWEERSLNIIRVVLGPCNHFFWAFIESFMSNPASFVFM